MIPITYVVGDATSPKCNDNENIIIMHCVNNIGRWGAGFVLAITKKWPEAEKAYRKWFKSQPNKLSLGDVQFVKVERNIWIANLVGQNGIRSPANIRPVDYNALRKGMKAVNEFAKQHNTSVHTIRIGCGLAGGNWNIVSKIIEEELCLYDVKTFVYDL